MYIILYIRVFLCMRIQYVHVYTCALQYIYIYTLCMIMYEYVTLYIILYLYMSMRPSPCGYCGARFFTQLRIASSQAIRAAGAVG